MDMKTTEKLEDVNKFIFVKKYNKASSLLSTLLDKFGNNEAYLLLHLRFIELSSKSLSPEKIKSNYVTLLNEGKLSKKIALICISLIELQGGLVEPSTSLSELNKIILNYGESAAAYFGLAYCLEHQGNLDRAIENYQKSINLDTGWYPSYFGLSQSHYQKNNGEEGDHYFYLFEKYAPYNLYGNFETHKRLSEEFLHKKLYEEADIAISMLSEWWLEHKGECPLEVQIYERLTLINIAKKQKKTKEAEKLREQTLNYAVNILNSGKIEIKVLYFIAKALDEYCEEQTALLFYKKILKTENVSNEVIQKIGKRFLHSGDSDTAFDLFNEAYELIPQRKELRFFKLMSELSINHIDINDYLLRKEKIIKSAESNNYDASFLKDAKKLAKIYNKDAEVHEMLGNYYYEKNMYSEADEHFLLMYKLDSKNDYSKIKYAKYLSAQGLFDRVRQIISETSSNKKHDTQFRHDLYWLHAHCDASDKKFTKAIKYMRELLDEDPWNLNYLSNQIIWSMLNLEATGNSEIDRELQQIVTLNEVPSDWTSYQLKTKAIERSGHWDLAYTRHKLYFLHQGASEESVKNFVSSALQSDPSKAYNDLIKLINTNFDSPWVFWGLGLLSKEMWQLETACMWFEQSKSVQSLEANLRALLYLEISDCYIWRNFQVPKAIEFVKIADQIKGGGSEKGYILLAHANLLLGKIRESQSYLEQISDEKDDFEAIYLKGLIEYRNGLIQKAKKRWKPLLTAKSKCLKTHHIKQDLMKYYFNQSSYFKAQ